MLRFRAFIALLLPVFWLVTAMPCPLEASEAVAPEFAVPSGTTQQTSPDGARECCCQIDSARCQWRRSPSEELAAGARLLRIVTAPAIEPHLCASAETSFAEDGLMLPQSWQFLWRTATPPRTPSLVI